MRISILAFLAACACAGCATTGTDGSSRLAAAPTTEESVVAEETAAEAADGSKIICRRIDSTGTHLSGKRVCKSQRSWDEYARRTQKDLTGLQRGNGGATVSN